MSAWHFDQLVALFHQPAMRAAHNVSSVQLALLGHLLGEELAVIFEQTTVEDAQWQVERWRLGVSELQWREENLMVTFSAGIGANEGLTVEALLEAVDQALYRAKEDGRNRLYRAA